MSLFSDILVAKCLREIEHSSPMPPFLPKTKVVKLLCSTQRTRLLYSLFFEFSYFFKISFADVKEYSLPILPELSGFDVQS